MSEDLINKVMAEVMKKLPVDQAPRSPQVSARPPPSSSAPTHWATPSDSSSQTSTRRCTR
ncbi:hypothetical protein G7085_08825 [Tessaracoccus sp. HDW20]|uniref:hypothetical protein n=1 Tax=Tessaracoccus coleopterorum TaxID=2714950 RepID=UPI0018D40325|nr:hypothetical protein [Tessaracoccus coleopterorum]NHB84678.1 hypothetical protein [Tessaracoccus coleopterorum]